MQSSCVTQCFSGKEMVLLQSIKVQHIHVKGPVLPSQAVSATIDHLVKQGQQTMSVWRSYTCGAPREPLGIPVCVVLVAPEFGRPPTLVLLATLIVIHLHILFVGIHPVVLHHIRTQILKPVQVSSNAWKLCKAEQRISAMLKYLQVTLCTYGALEHGRS